MSTLVNARAYHAALPAGVRSAVHSDFIHDRIRVVVATVAFGMGIDHSETRIVINYGLVKNLESLVQMTGRAGRDGAEAQCTLFYAQKDYSMVRFWQKGSGAASATQGGQSQSSSTPQSIHVSKLFDNMKAYVNDSRCRRIPILEYFGQTFHQYALGEASWCSQERGLELNDLLFFVFVWMCLCVR